MAAPPWDVPEHLVQDGDMHQLLNEIRDRISIPVGFFTLPSRRPPHSRLSATTLVIPPPRQLRPPSSVLGIFSIFSHILSLHPFVKSLKHSLLCVLRRSSCFTHLPHFSPHRIASELSGAPMASTQSDILASREMIFENAFREILERRASAHSCLLLFD
ncbi:hypothetical protein EV2_027094 [Malus domestica]